VKAAGVHAQECRFDDEQHWFMEGQEISREQMLLPQQQGHSVTRVYPLFTTQPETPPSPSCYTAIPRIRR